MEKKKTTKKKKKNGKRKMLSAVRKDASVFLTSEEGKIIKKDIVKMALAMGLTAASLSTAQAQTHTDSYAPPTLTHTDQGQGSSLHTDYPGDSRLINPGGYHSSTGAGHQDNTVINPNHTDTNAVNQNHTDSVTHSSHSDGGWC